MSQTLSRPDAERRRNTLASTKISFSLRLKRVLRAWQLYVLLAPAIVYVASFKYWPMYGVQIAFKNYNPIDGFSGSPWVGLDNFVRFMNRTSSARSSETRCGSRFWAC